MAEPEWSDLKVVLALYRGGSVASAARILGVDGSTVSRRLAAAEHAIGAVLIVRGGRGFAFTAEGRAVVQAAEATEAAVSVAAAAVKASRTGLQGIVRLSCAPSVVYFLRDFQKRVTLVHPGLAVELASGRAVADLAKGEVDIAMRGIRPTELDVIVRHTFDWGSAVYAATTYLEQNGHPASFEELRRHRLVRYNESFMRVRFASWIEQYVDPTLHTVRVDSIDMAGTMIAAGDGIGVLICSLGDALPGVARVFPEPVDTVPGYVVYHESSRGSARVKAVVDLLIDYIVEHRHVLSG